MSKEVKIVPFSLDHFDLIDLRPSEQSRMKADPKMAEKLSALSTHGYGGTMLYDGRVIAIFGYIMLWPGVIEVWSFPSIHVKQYSMQYLRTLKRYLDSLSEIHDIHRLQSTAISDDTHDRWMKFLGFTCEGLLRQFSADKVDHKIWGQLVK